MAINDSVPIIDLDGILLLSIEETLPLSGPSAEQLVRDAAAAEASSSPAARSSATPPPPSASPPPRRSLRQQSSSSSSSDSSNGQMTEEDAHVHATVLLVTSNPRDAPAAGRQLRAAVGGGTTTSSALARAMLERGIPTEKVGLLSLTRGSPASWRDEGPEGGGEQGLGASVAAAAAGARRQQEEQLQRRGSAAMAAEEASGGLSNGAIAGVVAGVVAIVAVSACLVAFVARVVARKSNVSGVVEKGEGQGGKGKALESETPGSAKALGSPRPPPPPFSAASVASPFADAKWMPSVRPSTAGSVAVVAPRGETAALATAGSSGRASSPATSSASAAASDAEAAAAALDVPFSELRLLAPIGEGAFGRVWLARWGETAVAVKVLNAAAAASMAPSRERYQHRIGGGDSGQQHQQRPQSAPPLLSALRREAGIMSRLRHPNVLQYLGTVAEGAEGAGRGSGSSGFGDGGSVGGAGGTSSSPSPSSHACSHPVTAVIAEYCPHGSVADLLDAAREAVEREKRRRSGSSDAAASTAYVNATAAEGSGTGGDGGGQQQQQQLQHRPGPDARAVRAVRQWETRLALALGAAKGMLYLHSRSPAPVLHRDLKAANVLVDGSMRAKVADFNLAREGEVGASSSPLSSSSASAAAASAAAAGVRGGPSAASASSSLGGAANPRWLAPEVLRGEACSMASDVYSFGVFLWELACWETPWAEAPGPWAVAIGVVERGERPPLPPAPAAAAAAAAASDGSSGAPGGSSSLSATPGGSPVDEAGYLSLMASCWAQDPKERPGFAEVIARLRPVAAAERLRKA